jgi:hypothetical protein
LMTDDNIFFFTHLYSSIFLHCATSKISCCSGGFHLVARSAAARRKRRRRDAI